MAGLCNTRSPRTLLARCAVLALWMLAVTAVPALAQEEDAGEMSTADAVAQRLVDAHGADAWASLPYLRFDFAVEGEGQTQLVARNLWNRRTGAYRVELPDTLQTVIVVQTNDSQPGSVAGTVYQNGEEVSGDTREQMLKTGYQRFINDTYWLLAPLKVFDEGVNRSYVADSSDAEHDVLHLTFGDVGLTPDDEYWLYVNKDTGLLDRWAFRLQSMPDDATPAAFDWTGYKTLSAPDGDVQLAERHEGGRRAILTNNLSAPDAPPENAFTTPTPILAE